MTRLRIVEGDDVSDGLTGSVLFGILWGELVDLLGAPATAAIMRRALRRALPGSQELRGLTIERVDGRFVCAVPASLGQVPGPPPAICALLDELRPLLAELTGEVAQRHLEQVPALRRWARAAPQA